MARKDDPDREANDYLTSQDNYDKIARHVRDVEKTLEPGKPKEEEGKKGS